MFTRLADKSMQEADMVVRMDETHSQHVCRGGDVKVTQEEIQKTNDELKYTCDFCKHKFDVKRGENIHRASCIHQCTSQIRKVWIKSQLRSEFTCRK